MVGKPYKETRGVSHMLREFDADVSHEELVWHRDKRTRAVTPVKCEGWKFQRDNEPPFEMEEGETIVIEAETFHRIIRGSGKLVLEIRES